MSKCPVCTNESEGAICTCGYSTVGKSVMDWHMFRATIHAIPSSRWPERVLIIRNACNATNKSEREVARHLGVSPILVSRAVRLSDGVNKWPTLMACKNMEDALRKLEVFRRHESGDGEAIPWSGVFDQERDLQDFLQREWSATSLSNEWNLDTRGHVDAGEVGIIDLLARHKTKPIWLVIELKVRRTSDDVLGQVLRYMGWMRRKYIKSEDSVEGLIIAQEPDTKTLYGLECLPDVRMQCYEYKNETLKLQEIDLERHLKRQLESFSREELLKLLERKTKYHDA